MYIMILKWTCAIFFSSVICNFKVDRVGFLNLFIGDAVQIYEEGDGMYICTRYQMNIKYFMTFKHACLFNNNSL